MVWSRLLTNLKCEESFRGHQCGRKCTGNYRGARRRRNLGSRCEGSESTQGPSLTVGLPGPVHDGQSWSRTYTAPYKHGLSPVNRDPAPPWPTGTDSPGGICHGRARSAADGSSPCLYSGRCGNRGPACRCRGVGPSRVRRHINLVSLHLIDVDLCSVTEN